MAPSVMISVLAAFCLSGTAVLAVSPNNNTGASFLINSAIEALGGREALAALEGVTYEAARQVQCCGLMYMETEHN